MTDLRTHTTELESAVLQSAVYGDWTIKADDHRSGLLYVRTIRVGMLDATLETGIGRKNLLALYALATRQQVDAGLTWFYRVHTLAEELAYAYGYTVGEVAGAISAVSPQIKWRDNVILATLCCRVARDGGSPFLASFHQTLANRAKAVAYLRGYSFTGPKVTAFCHTITYPSTSTEVTIDTHAICGYLGLKAHITQFSDTRYSSIADDYRAVAKHVGIQPHQLEAITWVSFRENVLRLSPDSPIDAAEAIQIAEVLPC